MPIRRLFTLPTYQSKYLRFGLAELAEPYIHGTISISHRLSWKGNYDPSVLSVYRFGFTAE